MTTTRTDTWWDVTTPLEERIESLLAEMTLEEKTGQLHLGHDLHPENNADEIDQGLIGAGIYSRGANIAHVPTSFRPAEMADRIAACQERAAHARLGIPLLFGSDIVHGHTTTFPIPFGMAATWDLELVADSARQAAAEALAEGITWTFTPMVDLTTEPRWGRIGESYGGEPLLAAQLAAATVRGLQGDGPGDGVSACLKHFCGYGLVQAERDQETLSVGLNSLHNLHLRPFRAGLDAGCRSVMVGLNDVDGTPMHCHRDLVRSLLKDDWGFDGVVVSDWDGIGQLVHQGVAIDLRDAVRQAIEAGIDMDMVSGGYRTHLPDLVRSGEVDEDLVDDAVRRVLRLKMRSGLFDRPPRPRPSNRRAASHHAHPTVEPAADELARHAATASMVLVKNAGSILPLHGNFGTIHLCGPFVREGRALLGNWVFFDEPVHGDTVEEALGARFGHDDVLVSDGRFADLSLRYADLAEVTIAIVGEHYSRSGEDRCIARADLPPGQLEMLRALAAVGKPLIVVVAAGRPLELSPIMEVADAVLLCWFPGSEAGNALADVLLGEVAPSGRLPMNLSRMVRLGASGTLERTTGRRLGRSSDTKFGRFLNSLVHPEFSLGYGLSYTSFAYSNLELSRDWLPIRNGSVRATVEVANTGHRHGREVVQLYIRDLVAEVSRPLVELADWRIVDLDPNQTKRVTFKINAGLFSYVGRDLRFRVDPGEVEVIIGPNASRGSAARLRLVEGGAAATGRIDS